jgi:ribosomal-protein-alanine acetyltransferase
MRKDIGQNMQIRRMTPEDIPAAAELERMCLAEAWSENSYRSAFRMDGTDSWFWVAEENGVLNGIIGLSRMGEDGEIGNVAVRPERRRQGIAEALLQTALSYGEMQLGMRNFTLEVRSGNTAAIHLYEKAAFRTEGIRPHFYRNPTEDARILWRRAETGDSC